MIPVEFFTQLAQVCADRPFLLLSKDQQDNYLTEIKKIVSALRANLEQKQLQHTHAYKIVQAMATATATDKLDEVRFAEALAQLDTLYGSKYGSNNDLNTKPDFLADVRTMDTFAERFKKRAQEFHILETRATQAATKLTPDQIAEHDKTTLQNIGLFYILEYTLILEQEMHKADATQQKHILENGIQVAAGNLPGLKPLMKSFYQELAFQLYNQSTRWQVLRLFFAFQDTCQDTLTSGQMTAIMSGLRSLNVELLQIVLAAGIETFTGVVYKPYPDGTPIKDIITDLSTN